MGTGEIPGSLFNNPVVKTGPEIAGLRPRIAARLAAASVTVALTAGLLPENALAQPPVDDGHIENVGYGLGHLSDGEVLKINVPDAVGGKAVFGNLASDRSDADGYVTAYPCDQPRPLASDLNPVAGEVRSNRLITYADQAGNVCLYTLRGTDLIVDVDGIADVSSFASRRTDTRETGNHLDPGEVLEVFVPEAVGGKTVVGNLASANSDANGFVTAYPCDQPRPLASDLNPVAGEVISNRFIGEAGNDGRICFYTLNGTDLVFDANGILNGGQPFDNRRVDTRETGHLAAGQVLEVFVPEAVGGKTVVGNLASDRTGVDGYITAYPCSEQRPIKSDLNPIKGRVVAERLITKADAAGKICFFTLKDTDLIVDANGVVDGAQSIPHLRFDTREETSVEPVGDARLLWANGTKWVGPEDIEVSCEAGRQTYGGANDWVRYTRMTISNQQPSDPSFHMMGSAVVMWFEDPEYPVNDLQRIVVVPSQRSNTDGVITGWSTTYLTAKPLEYQALRVTGVTVRIQLTEYVSPIGSQMVGESAFLLTIPSCTRLY